MILYGGIFSQVIFLIIHFQRSFFMIIYKGNFLSCNFNDFQKVFLLIIFESSFSMIIFKGHFSVIFQKAICSLSIPMSFSMISYKGHFSSSIPKVIFHDQFQRSYKSIIYLCNLSRLHISKGHYKITSNSLVKNLSW